MYKHRIVLLTGTTVSLTLDVKSPRTVFHLVFGGVDSPSLVNDDNKVECGIAWKLSLLVVEGSEGIKVVPSVGTKRIPNNTKSSTSNSSGSGLGCSMLFWKLPIVVEGRWRKWGNKSGFKSRKERYQGNYRHALVDTKCRWGCYLAGVEMQKRWTTKSVSKTTRRKKEIS
jgi:hypothetical protein